MGANILVVDDGLTIQKIIQMTLVDQNYHLTFASDETKMWEILSDSQNVCNLIFLDFTISTTTDGYALTKKIKESNKNTKVVLLFGTFDFIDEINIKKFGADGKLIKPFDSGELLDYCEHLLNDNDSSLSTLNPQELFERSDFTDLNEEITFEDSVESNSESQTLKIEIPNNLNQTDEELGQWVVQSNISSHDLNNNITESASKMVTPPPIVKDLKQEMMNWGVVVPPKLDIDDLAFAMPPMPPILPHQEENPFIHEAVTMPPLMNVAVPGDISEVEIGYYPNSDDLSYPEIAVEKVAEIADMTEMEEAPVAKKEEMFTPNIDININLATSSELPSARVTSQLISVEDLQLATSPSGENENKEKEEKFEHTATYVYNPEGWKRPEDHAHYLQKIIADEVQTEELWTVDEVRNQASLYDSGLDLPTEDFHSLSLSAAEVIAEQVQKVPEPFVTPTLVINSTPKPELSQEEMLEKLWQLVEPELPNYMQKIVVEHLNKQGEQLVEQYLWKILPDLAEKVIAEQVDKIAEEVKTQYFSA